MSSDTNVSGLFASALGTEPAPAPAAKSSCCGPKPEAKKEDAVAEAPKASSCCGPKPAATDAPAEAAPKAKSSCCG